MGKWIGIILLILLLAIVFVQAPTDTVKSTIKSLTTAFVNLVNGLKFK